MAAIPILILPEAIPSWAYLLATAIASLLSGGALSLWLRRKTPAAEIHESRARAAKSFAEADEITVRASLSLGEEAVHWTRAMMRAQQMIFSLQEKNDQLEAENRRLRAKEPRQIRK
jgi:hypothetical protein